MPTSASVGGARGSTSAPRGPDFLPPAVAELYRSRWRIEGAFHELEAAVRGEVETLGYPKAALLAFCVALVAFDVLRMAKAATGPVTGLTRAEVPGADTAEEVAGTTRGKVIAIAPSVWPVFARMSAAELAGVFRNLGRRVWLPGVRKRPRGPKKVDHRGNAEPEPDTASTARLLQKRPQK